MFIAKKKLAKKIHNFLFGTPKLQSKKFAISKNPNKKFRKIILFRKHQIRKKYFCEKKNFLPKKNL